MRHVEIMVEGRIDSQWSEWLENLAITHPEPDKSVLVGEVIDQAALYGLLNKLRDLSLALISVSVETEGFERTHHHEQRETVS